MCSLDSSLVVSYKPSKEGIKRYYFKEKTTDFQHRIFIEEIKKRIDKYVIYKISDNKVV